MKSSLLYSGFLTLIVVDFHISSTYDVWPTLSSKNVAKIHLLFLLARTGRHALSNACQSLRQSGIGNSTYNVPAVRILSPSSHGLSVYRAVAVSDNGWTTDQLALEWVKHFNRHTETCTVGAWRLLIVDGHGSHATLEFDQFCTDNKIITLRMPAYTSHLLQPLDVGCFSPLKTLYEHEVSELARQSIYHVDKLDFLQIYKNIRRRALSDPNIKAGF
jgi:hypothetical protein